MKNTFYLLTLILMLSCSSEIDEANSRFDVLLAELKSNPDSRMDEILNSLDTLVASPIIRESQDFDVKASILNRLRHEKRSYDEFKEAEKPFNKLLPILKYIEQNENKPNIEILKIKNAYITYLKKLNKELDRFEIDENDDYGDISRKVKKQTEYLGELSSMRLFKTGNGMMKFGILGAQEIYSFFANECGEIEFVENNISIYLEEFNTRRKKFCLTVQDTYDEYNDKIVENLNRRVNQIRSDETKIKARSNEIKQSLCSYQAKKDGYKYKKASLLYHISKENMKEIEDDLLPDFSNYVIHEDYYNWSLKGINPENGNNDDQSQVESQIDEIESNPNLTDFEKSMKSLKLLGEYYFPLAADDEILSIRPLECTVTNRFSGNEEVAVILITDSFKINPNNGEVLRHKTDYSFDGDDQFKPLSSIINDAIRQSEK